MKEPDGLGKLFHDNITKEKNERLAAVPSQEEIWRCVREMHSLKAPGLDGLQGVFHRTC